MILSIPIFGENIELIIESTLEFYHTNETFMVNFWQSLARIAQSVEGEEQKAHKPIKSFTELVSSKKKSAQTFCHVIQESLIAIKQKALRYVELFLQYIQQDAELQNSLNIFVIFLLFIQHTQSEVIIRETCKILEKSKQLFTYQCFKSDIYTQIEQFLIRRVQDKKRSFLTQRPSTRTTRCRRCRARSSS